MSENIMKMSREDVRRFIRFEEITEEYIKTLRASVTDAEHYEPSLDDALAALNNVIESNPDMTELQQWDDILWRIVFNISSLDSYPRKNIIPHDDKEAIDYVYSYLANDAICDILNYEDTHSRTSKNIHYLINYIEDHRYNKGRPVGERRFADWQMRSFIGRWDSVAKLAQADGETLVLFRECVARLLRSEDETALLAKAYGCYSGNAAFSQNWEESCRCLTILAERYENPNAANSLGYIYYYGRCNNGVPQYDMALRYFTVGAMCGVMESRYKIADMLLFGRGLPQNERAAMNVYYEVYRDCHEEFCSGEYWSSFADAALRYGKALMDDDLYMYGDDESPYEVLLKARYAIRERIKHDERYGDRKVETSINEALEQARDEWLDGEIREEYRMHHLYYIDDLLGNGNVLDFSITDLGDGRHEIKARLVNGRKTFYVIPYCDYAVLTDEITLIAEGAVIHLGGKSCITFIADSIACDTDRCTYSFFFGVEKVFEMGAGSFVVRPHESEDEL